MISIFILCYSSIYKSSQQSRFFMIPANKDLLSTFSAFWGNILSVILSYI